MKTACRPGIFPTDTPKPGESALVAHLTTHSNKNATSLIAQRHINTHHMAVPEFPPRVLPLQLHALPINHSQDPAITPLKLVFGSVLSLVGCQVLGNRHFLGERQHTQCLLTPEREPATGENNDYTDVQFVEPLTFFLLELLTKVVVKGYFQKAGITQKQLRYQQTISTRMVTPKEGTLELSAELARCSAVHHVASSAVSLLRVSLLPPLPATVFLPVYCWSKALKNTPSTIFHLPQDTRRCVYLLFAS